MIAGNSLIFQIIFLFILVGINGFFASSEIAIISMNDNKIKKMADEGHKKAALLHKLVSEPSRFLATIQVGITLSGLLASALASESFADILVAMVKNTGILLDESIIKAISVILITILLAYFQLVLGELVPKRIAMQNPESISMLTIKPLSFLASITEPFVKLLTYSTNFIIRLFGGNPDINEESITEEEIRLMVDVGQERGVIQGAEKEMINNIFEFNNTIVSEAMTHRIDIVALPLTADLDDIIDVIIKEKFTRIPVYDEVIDNIVGILHAKDLMPLMKAGSKEGFELSNVMRQPYFVPWSKKTDELFKELQKRKIHMAVVIDEYGGTAGIVTFEDLIEEIVGNIFDEYDEDTREIDKIDENTFMVDGTTSLDTVSGLLDTELPVDEYDTLSGFIIGQIGRIPLEDEKPEIEFNGVIFKVEEIEEKRISKIKICKAC